MASAASSPFSRSSTLSVDVGVDGRHAVIAHQGHHRRLEVERGEQPGELAVDRLPDPLSAPPRERPGAPAVKPGWRGSVSCELVPGLVDDRDVAHQQVPAGALRRGEQGVAEEAGEAVGLLAPGREIDPRLGRPGVAQAASSGGPGQKSPRAGERRGEIFRVGAGADRRR